MTGLCLWDPLIQILYWRGWSMCSICHITCFILLQSWKIKIHENYCNFKSVSQNMVLHNFVSSNYLLFLLLVALRKWVNVRARVRLLKNSLCFLQVSVVIHFSSGTCPCVYHLWAKTFPCMQAANWEKPRILLSDKVRLSKFHPQLVMLAATRFVPVDTVACWRTVWKCVVLTSRNHALLEDKGKVSNRAVMHPASAPYLRNFELQEKTQRIWIQSLSENTEADDCIPVFHTGLSLTYAAGGFFCWNQYWAVPVSITVLCEGCFSVHHFFLAWLQMIGEGLFWICWGLFSSFQWFVVSGPMNSQGLCFHSSGWQKDLFPYLLIYSP